MSSPSLHDVVGHWATLIENLQTSPLQFYESVEKALDRRDVPSLDGDRVDHKEAGLLSAEREYLRIRRERLTFDICAAPFGTGFFVSWWLTERSPRLGPFAWILVFLGMLYLAVLTVYELGFFWGPVVLVVVPLVLFALVSHLGTDGDVMDDFCRSLPLVGVVYERLFKPDTYFRIDSMLMFQKALHSAVLEVVDELTTANGVRALAESDRKPIMREFYRRKVT